MSSKLVQVFARKGLSLSGAARRIGPDKKLVIDSSLGDDFLHELCTGEHVPAPYIARKRARK